jgi:predicted HTH transcriptional regulator
MPDSKRALSAPRGKCEQAVAKPTPPSDLWQQLAEMEADEASRPTNSFSCRELADNLGLPGRTAFTRIETWLKDGKIKFVGKFKRHKMYVLVEKT